MKIRSAQYFTVLLFLFLFFHQSSFAQKQISGSVTIADGNALAYANVLLLQSIDSTFVSGNVTNMNGNYELVNIKPGTYLINISMIGYQSHYSEIINIVDQEGAYTISTIALLENTTQLEEVQVVEKRALFEQKIDRMVVNVDNSITSAGSTALEVLKRSPGVMVNPQSNSIAMSGKDGVVVMMNGKITRMPMDAVVQMLAGMNADNIDKIELIHTPPANFDAEGNAGFINIILKKNESEGWNGGFAVNVGYGKKEKAGASLDFNYRKNKINFFGDYSWKYNYNPQIFRNYRSFILDGEKIESSNESDRDPTRLYVQNARLGLDIQLSDKTIVGGLVSWMDRDWTMDAINDNRNFENGVLESRINTPNNEINHAYNILGNINLQHQFTGEEQLNIDLDYAYFYNDNPSFYTNQFFDGDDNLIEEKKLRVAKTTPMNIWVGKADYSKKIGEDINLELGVKGTSTDFDNDILVEDFINNTWTIAPFFSSKAKMREKIAAAYSALSFKWGKKTDVKLGLRYEFTDANLGTIETPDLVDRQYSNLFPSIFISNKINEINNIQFSYSRRINRPSFRQLAPYFIFYDPSTVETGNPALQPSITDAFRGTYIWKTVQLGVQYAYTNDVIGIYQPEVDLETNTQVNGAKNFIDGHLASATLSFPIKITNWWTLRTSWTTQWSKINDKVDNRKISFDQTSWYMNGATSFTLPKDFSLEISGTYFSPSMMGSVIWQSFNSVDIGIQKQLKNNGRLRFSISDVFLGGNYKGLLDDPNVNFNYEGYYGLAERIFRLSYAHRFGNKKVKGARKRTTGSAEEQQRVN